MANILLIEPDYKCKYPPLGLMKIAYYHKENCNDIVWFTKGRLPIKISEEVKGKINNSKYYKDKFEKENTNIDEYIENLNHIIKDKLWDRVYVTSLFTYEFDKTKEAINYAKEITNKDLTKIVFGGISATLLEEKYEIETGIKSITGQLINSSMIGYEDNVNIDTLTPDYSILDNISYEYTNNNAYYAYTTRGCGMKCGFCAVQKLEPEYRAHISIKDQILEINEKYGEKKDLLLMDNNVLKSGYFYDIIDEIISLGYEKGKNFYTNPITNNQIYRYIDFNQGLDAKLFSEDKIKELSKIAIRPARIAFDHIEDKDVYESAIKLAAKHDITNLSNYLLYNAPEFSGKGTAYKADRPEDLYNRLKINVDLQEEINKERVPLGKEKIHIFSFPMKYIPLEDTDRKYIGPNWTIKYLRAIQAFLIPTQGKGVSSKSFFEAAFGVNLVMFKEALIMPENYITTRGEPEKITGIDEDERQEKIKSFEEWAVLREEWRKIYSTFNEDEKDYFVNRIGDNVFSYDIYRVLKEEKYRMLYVHYFTENSLLMEIFDKLYMEDDIDLLEELVEYFNLDGKCIYRGLVKYIAESNIMNRQKDIFIKVFKQNGIFDVVGYWLKSGTIEGAAFNLIKTYKKYLNRSYYNFNKILWVIKEKINFTDNEADLIIRNIKNIDIDNINMFLNNKLNQIYKLQIDKFKKNLISKEECLNIFKVIFNDTNYKPNK